jgi:hypothetical protein
MSKPRKRIGTSNGARKPSWISDTENQRKWNERFRAILKRDYENSDDAIRAILSDVYFCDLCATKIRSYVDKAISAWLNMQKKNRGAKIKRQLELAIAGLQAAKEICEQQGNQPVALNLGILAKEFSQALARCKLAFAVKRRGRDRDHSILDECRGFIQKTLAHSVTNKTLANLVNAGYETDDNLPTEPVTEEQIRKNLANFTRNNPFWRNEIDPRFHQRFSDPETK